MCFAAEVDLAAGLVVGAIGVDTIRHARTKADLPMAVLPMLLGVHQLSEVLVWLGLEGEIGGTTGRAAVWFYLIVAFGVLPLAIPLAMVALEAPPVRRRLAVFVVVGVAVAGMLMSALLRGPIVAQIQQNHIDYRVDVWNRNAIAVLYVVATCGPLLLSSQNHLKWFGAANLVVAGLIGWIEETALVSLWCLWAAVASGAFAYHLRFSARPEIEKSSSAQPVEFTHP